MIRKHLIPLLSKKAKYSMQVETFNSAQDMVSTNEHRMVHNGFKNMSRISIDRGFHGVSTFSEAYTLLKDGYAPTVEKLRNSIKCSSAKVRNRVFNDVVGYTPNVPLALQGVPTSMVNVKKTLEKTKVIDLYYDMTVACSKRDTELIQAGQLVLRIITEMESRGYKFNLYCVQSYGDGTSTDMVAIKVKSSGQPMDLKRVSFPLTHPAFFRVIGFDWYSKVPNGVYRTGYGHAFSYLVRDGYLSKDDVKHIYKSVFGRNAVRVSCADIIEGGYAKEVVENAIKYYVNV